MASKRRFGALRKLPSGRWQARYRTPDGALVTAGKTFATKTDGARFLDAIELDQLRGVWHDPAPSQHETVGDWCRRWLKQHATSLTPSTAASYDGLRIGEALALRRRHVDVLGSKLIVAESLTEINGEFSFGPTKTHQVREVPLPRTLMADLEQYVDEYVAPTTDALLFTSATG